jgi:hypothetical protein
MRSRTGNAAAAVVLSSFLMPLGCGGKRSEVKVPAQKRSPGRTTPALPPLSEEVPVTAEFLGLSADKEHVRYRIHVVTDKPIRQVDVGLTYNGADGKEQRATVVWNVDQSSRQPVEKGKTHEDVAYVGRGATGVVCKVLHVVYRDMTSWAPTRYSAR